MCSYIECDVADAFEEKGIMMRKLALAAVMASSALASPALARDGAWYAGIEAGAVLMEDLHFDLARAGVTTTNAYGIDHEYGYDVGGQLGYDFGLFRAEMELSYRDANLDQVTAATVADYPPAGIYEAADGNTRVMAAMLNGLFDFGAEGNPWGGFIGGGAGIARVKASQYEYVKSTGPVFLDDSDSGFAWQVLAGVRRALSENVDMSLKYRFFNAQDMKLDYAGGTFDDKLRSHSVLIGLTYNFGAAAPVEVAPAPAPAPVEAAPPPPPPAAPAPGPFLVFFDWDRAEVTPEAASILDRAAEAFRQTGQVSIMLAGHADRSGSDQYNMGLSERRAASVRDYLTSKGVPTEVISSEAFGESRPLVETADGVREPQNRRVEINFATAANAPTTSDINMQPGSTMPADDSQAPAQEVQ